MDRHVKLSNIDYLEGISRHLHGLVNDFLAEVEQRVVAVAELDVPENFPPDSFTNSFLPRYQGSETPTHNVALRENALRTSQAMAKILDLLPRRLAQFRPVVEEAQDAARRLGTS